MPSSISDQSERSKIPEARALAGDNKAAARMADYCYFRLNDQVAAIRWYKLAASRGDQVAKQNVKTLQDE